MKLEKKVIETIEKHQLISRGDQIVVGLSGGPDSLCLFNILLDLREEYDLTLTAVHINHGLRPGAADEDQAFVERFAKEKTCLCYVFSADCNALAKESGKSSEEVGRELRYSAFDQVARSLLAANESKDNKSIKIAVAHNANDQAETLMFRILRGTGIDGLAGMEYSRLNESNFQVIRPLLDCTRAEIEEYINIHQLIPCIDLTNDEPLYTRNKIRLNVLPALSEAFNPNLVETLGRLATSAQEDKNYIWQQTLAAYQNALTTKLSMEPEDTSKDTAAYQNALTTKLSMEPEDTSKDIAADKEAVFGAKKELNTDKEISFNLKELQKLHPAILHRVITMAFGQIGLTSDITRAHMESADALIHTGKTGSYVEFPKGYMLTLSYDSVLVRYAGLETNFNGSKSFATTDFKINIQKLAEGETTDKVLVTVNGPLRSIELRLKGFDIETLPEIELRTRRDGDYIVLSSKDQQITKKLQDFFTDAKVPNHLRDSVPLVASGREILLILGDEMTGLQTGQIKSRYTGNYR